MNALILTCNTGGGHNSVSSAVRESILNIGGTCEISDALSFLSERASEFICNWHVRIYRYMPKVFSSGYRIAEEHSSVLEEKSPIHKIIAFGADRLYEYVVKGGFDCLICPHVISSMLVSEMFLRHPESRLPSCNIATDYTCSPATEETDMDCYFVPDESVLPEFIRAGIPQEKLYCIDGIPVRHAFYTHGDKGEAKRALGVSEKARHLVMMFGSMGCGPMKELTELFLEQIPGDTYITIVCGTNEVLQRRLERLCERWEGNDRIHIKGFVNDSSLLMDSADLFLTKPGGISTSEAAAKGVPMVLADTVAGCEEYNYQLFCHSGGAVAADTPEALAALCIELLHNEEKLREMSCALKRHSISADEICRIMLEISPRKNGDEYEESVL